MKKIICFIMSFLLVFSVCVPASAGNSAKTVQPESVDHDPSLCTDLPVIIVRGMDFNGLYLNCGEDNEEPAIKAVKAGDIVSVVIKALFSSVFKFSFDPAMQEVADYCKYMMGSLAMNSDGSSKYNVGKLRFPESADKYDYFDEAVENELGMARACIEALPDGHTFYFDYDWRLDPFVVADEINEYVEKAVAQTGHQKVNIACASMGGIMTVAYLTKYGYERVNKCLFMSSTFCGAQVASDLLCGKVSITADNLYNYVDFLVSDKPVLDFACLSLYKIGAFGIVEKLASRIIEDYSELAYAEVLKPIFSYMLPLWGLVQPEDYNAALDYIFRNDKEENAEFIAKTQRLQDMMAGRTDLLYDMIENGVDIAVVSGYDRPVIPVYENADFTGDSILETYEMSGYATVAPYGKTLGNDYIAADPKLVSPDNIVDLSTAILPEYTYIIKGAPHVSCSYGTDYSEFFIWMLKYDGEFYAGVNEKYPQFMISGNDQSLRPF